LGTNFGISVITGWNGENPVVEIYNNSTGYAIKDVNTGQNCMFLDSKGIIWAGTGDKKSALVRFDYDAVDKEPHELPNVVFTVKINEETIDWYDLLFDARQRKTHRPLSPTDSLTQVQQEIMTYEKTLPAEKRKALINQFSDIQFDSITPFYPLPQNLVLPYKHNHITFDYLAVDLSYSKFINYQFFLDGNDDSWIDAGKQTSADYSNLKEGKYIFYIKAQTKNGQWTNPAHFTFKVLPPWYRTILAYIIYLLLLVFFVYAIIKIYTRNLRQEKIKLERTVRERTEEIYQQNEIIQEKVVSLNNEIDVRKKTEKMLKKLTVAVEQSPVSIVITDIKGVIEYVNPKYCESTGYSEKETIGNNANMIKGNTPATVYRELWKTILNGEIWMGEFENRKKNGEYHFEEAIIAPIKNEKDEIINFVAVKTDITERKKNENALKTSESNLKISNATKDKLFSLIAHDLRSPFSTIIGFSDLLAEGVETDSKEDLSHKIGFVQNAANKAFDLLTTLLDWARSQTNQISVQSSNFDISKLINSVIHEIENVAQSKNIQLTFSNQNDIEISSDKNLIKTVLRNLISNAIKYIKTDGQINISLNALDGFVEISVADNGIGMNDEIRNNLFLSNVNKSTYGTKNEKGTGLGLVICKEFVTKLGGKIWVDSQLDKGSTFYFTIPVK